MSSYVLQFPGGWPDPGLSLQQHQGCGAEHRGTRLGLDLHRALSQQQALGLGGSWWKNGGCWKMGREMGITISDVFFRSLLDGFG